MYTLYDPRSALLPHFIPQIEPNCWKLNFSVTRLQEVHVCFGPNLASAWYTFYVMVWIPYVKGAYIMILFRQLLSVLQLFLFAWYSAILAHQTSDNG